MDISTTNQKVIDTQFIVKKRLGKGYTAKVMLAEHTSTKTPVAIKIYVPRNGQALSMKEFKTEMESMQKIKSSNVISILAANNKGVYERPGKKSKQIVYIGMEVADNAELFDFIADPGKGFVEKIARFYFIQLISGLKAIHEEKFSHRDLKTENIFLDKDFNLKIGDFGFAKYVEQGKSEKLKTVLGTVGYQSPELLENKGYNGFSNDIFACGVILFIFANAYPPFKEAKVKDPWYKNLYNGEPKKFWELHAKRLAIKSEAFKTLITGMLAKSGRFTIEDIIASEWFNGELPSKEELLTDLGSRKKIVDANKKKQAEEKLKVKSGGSDNKVYRGDGDDIDVEKITELVNGLDLSSYKVRKFEDFNFNGKFSVLNFVGDSENDFSIEKVFKNLVVSLQRIKAETHLADGAYQINVEIKNYKYLEDEVEVEEDIGFTVELYSNGEFSSNAVIYKEDNTSFFTFKRFVDNWKQEFNSNDDE
jgi:serine/threonine protein kinase